MKGNPVTSTETFDADVRNIRGGTNLTPAQAEVGNQLLFKYGGDMRFLLVVGQVATIQMMLPAFSAVVEGYSQFYGDVWRRWFERTQPMLQRAVFDKDPEHVAHEIRDFHTNLEAVDDKGRHWHALDPNVFHWAHATQYYGVWRMAQLFDGRTFTAEENEAYYQATRRVWFQFGVSDTVSPPDWQSFLRFYENFIETSLEATGGAYDMIEFLTNQVPPPPVPGIPNWLWRKVADPIFAHYGRMTVGLLPQSARDILGVPWTDEDEQWLQTVGSNVARVARVTPEGWWISPEARAARFRSDKSLNGRFQYLAGESLQRPILAVWRATTR